MMKRLMLFFALLCGAALPAYAHKPSDSYLSLEVQGERVTGQWDIALRDLDFAIGLDQDGDGKLTWDEVRTRHAAIAAYALERLGIATDKGACRIDTNQQLVDDHTDGAYSVLRFRAACPGPVTALTINYQLFADLDPQHKGLLRLTHDGATSTEIFDPSHARQTLSLASPDHWQQFAAYVKDGVWHIWIGYDHILFLLSLLLPAVMLGARGTPSASLRESFIDVLKVVTAFTLAHSLTLTLASLSLISLPSRWVESAIAASVVLAALNNIYPLFRSRRPVAAFGFGLIHGFGFASVLIDLGLPQGALLTSLFGFNLGVEIGQLCIVAAFLPLAFALRGTWFYRRLLSGGSAAIALVAAVWLAERAFDMKLITPIG
ncbi:MULTISPECIES: HupE/UreJ family protein [unclassified Duganella]|uniref:HupE/UreJ family protein n=1 Tax=unclassified Duganella TaxID=2636909 RepID=UPI000E34BD79|nr:MULTISPECIES: HupE/UreJ family protein [unclassified Duganella]RFP12873.1 HupE/UreJ family protein [Duganella sp. BJB475]RFP28882.1 HupE/UreJ family protein [Duganella sp. BJB476]